MPRVVLYAVGRSMLSKYVAYGRLTPLREDAYIQ
jgi:hypothetical protein